ncbi:MAG: hypothetical protein AAB472_00615 [Patescibacteria group bacterium]
MGNHVGTENGPRVSKYAQKVSGRAQGIVPDFEFKASKQLVTEERKPEPAAPVHTTEVRILDLTVTNFFVGKGILFLESSQGEKVLMNYKLFCKHTGRSMIDLGWKVQAKVQENPNGKGLRVIRVLSYTPS